MAFPVVEGTQTGTDVNSSTITLTEPAGTAQGDLLLALMVDSTNSGTWSGWTGWTQLGNQNGFGAFVIERGASAPDLTGVGPNSNRARWIVYRISGHNGVSDVELSTLVTGSSNAPDIASFNPAGWGAEDTLWITFAAQHDGRTTGTAPTSYATEIGGNTGGGGGGTYMESAQRNNNTAAEDPAAWSLSRTDTVVAGLVAFRPSQVQPSGTSASTVNGVVSTATGVQINSGTSAAQVNALVSTAYGNSPGDVTIETDVDASHAQTRAHTFSNGELLAHIFIDGTRDVKLAKSSDGGATWATVTIEDTSATAIGAYAEWHHPTLTSPRNIIHVAWNNYDGSTVRYTQIDLDNSFNIDTPVSVATSISSSNERYRNDVSVSMGAGVGDLYIHAGFDDFTTNTAYGWRSTAASDGAAWSGITAFTGTSTSGNRRRSMLGFAGDSSLANEDTSIVWLNDEAADWIASTYDQSLDTWTNTTFHNETTPQAFQSAQRWNAGVDSSGRAIVALWQLVDNTAADVNVYRITFTATPSSATLTDVDTNPAENMGIGVTVSWTDDRYHVFWGTPDGAAQGAYQARMYVWYADSDDQGSTWNAKTRGLNSFSDWRLLSSPPAIPTGTGGNVFVVGQDQDVPNPGQSHRHQPANNLQYVTSTSASQVNGVVSTATGTSGAAAPSGTAASTVNALVSTAAGTAVNFVGSASSTVNALVSTATGVETMSGTAASVVNALVSTASGAQTMSGTAVSTVNALVSTASGTAVNFVGAASSQVNALVSTASGTVVNNVATAASQVNALVSTATGVETMSGTAASTVNALVSTASGNAAANVGTGSSTVNALISTASGTAVNNVATASSQVNALVSTAVGVETMSGTAASTVNGVVSTAVGATAANIATAASTVNALVSTAAGTAVNFVGAAASVINALVSTAAATAANNVGSAASTVNALVSTATGVETMAGTAASTVNAVVSTATGVSAQNVGSASSTVNALVSTAVGVETMSGTASSTVNALVSTAAGTAGGNTGTASSTVNALVSTASGTVTGPSGTAASTVNALVSTAVGAVTYAGTGVSAVNAVVSSAVGYHDMGPGTAVVGALTGPTATVTATLASATVSLSSGTATTSLSPRYGGGGALEED